MAKVELTGMDELLRNLNAVAGRLADRSAGKALTKGAEVLRGEVGKNAPRSRFNKKHLADNIVRSRMKTSKEGIKYIEVGPDKDFFYGKFLEFGTVKMSAQPFIGPALAEKRAEIFNTMARVLREEIVRFS